ncbi:MAG: isoprenyl transferase [Clostridia bacterium]|nr:isoprenyl transferase [Clostridia bacterium]
MIFSKKNKKHEGEMPKHIGIIMDGNGRWARRRGLPRSAGHAAGAENFKRIVTFCGEIGIAYLTVYAFSTENWNRPQAEVDEIMRLMDIYLDDSYKELEGKNVVVKIIGERGMLTQKLQDKIAALEKHTSKNTGLVLNIALSYGGRQEIVHAAKECARLAAEGKISPDDIDEEMVSSHIYTAGQPDPDFIIRPSGEKRLSNFLTWQSAYSEFWFSDIMWPAFTKKHLMEAIEEYQKRNRRFGAL